LNQEDRRREITGDLLEDLLTTHLVLKVKGEHNGTNHRHQEHHGGEEKVTKVRGVKDLTNDLQGGDWIHLSIPLPKTRDSLFRLKRSHQISLHQEKEMGEGEEKEKTPQREVGPSSPRMTSHFHLQHHHHKEEENSNRSHIDHHKKEGEELHFQEEEEGSTVDKGHHQEEDRVDRILCPNHHQGSQESRPGKKVEEKS
jgi:hypothetical protein